MNSNWQTKKLGEITNFQRGLTYKKKDEVSFSNSVVLRANNINIKNNSLDLSDLKYINESISIPPLKKVNKGSLLICTASGSKSHLGKVALIDQSYGYAFGGFMGQLHPNNEIDSKYLFYNLTSDDYKDFINKLSNGVNINNLKYDDLKAFKVSFPSLSEQQRIVSILDRAFENINKAKENIEKNIKNSKELFESYLENISQNSDGNWLSTSLEVVCEISSKLVDPTNKEFLNLIHVGGANMGKKGGKLINLKTALEEKLTSGKFLFDNTMILYSKIRPYLMKVARPDFKGLCSADIYPLKPKNNKIYRDYLYYLLLTNNFTKYAIKGSGRAGMPKVNRNHLFNYKFSMPSFEEQEIIVLKLDELSSQTKQLEEIYKKKLLLLEELKRSILHKAFNGEL